VAVRRSNGKLCRSCRIRLENSSSNIRLHRDDTIGISYDALMNCSTARQQKQKATRSVWIVRQCN
jgi:hypothetical protein